MILRLILDCCHLFFRDLWQKKPLLVRRHIETYNDGWFSTKELDRILKQVWRKLIQAKLLSIDLPQGCHGQGKVWKMIFLQVREKSGNFIFSEGNLEKMKKVRE